MKVIFMGTPDFAVPAFRRLAASGHELILAVTQPDKPRGRGKKILPPPIKAEALKQDIPVLQPASVREAAFQRTLRDYAPEIIVVVAFGQLIPGDILDLPPFGCVNLHASLLPKYRGAAPIERAMMEGASITGNTTMLMDEGLDTGDILLQEAMAIPAHFDASHVYARLAESGGDLILKTLDALQKKEISPRPQGEEATYAPRLRKQDGLIAWNKGSTQIVNLVRALARRPGAYTFLKGARVKIWKAEIPGGKINEQDPGRIIAMNPEGIYVSAGEGAVLVKELQAEGKKRREAHRFAQGTRLAVGDRFTQCGGER